MDKSLNIAIAQPPGMLDGTHNRLAWLEMQLQSENTTDCDVLILPELFQSGYYTAQRISDVAEPSDGPFAQQVRRLAITHNIAIVYGYAEQAVDALYNSAQCIDDSGVVIGHHRKLLSPPGFEQSVFTQGSDCNVFKLGDFHVSILICYDIEFPETIRHVAAAGAELVIAPTALTEEWGLVSEKLIPTRAFENGVFIAYANHSGRENDATYFGGSCIVAPNGRDLARATNNVCMLKATVDKSQVKKAQTRMPYLAHYSALKPALSLNDVDD
ncbi:MAG: carbon-nitrogen hydrolase family protein [Granulosicoccus sp.]